MFKKPRLGHISLSYPTHSRISSIARTSSLPAMTSNCAVNEPKLSEEKRVRKNKRLWDKQNLLKGLIEDIIKDDCIDSGTKSLMKELVNNKVDVNKCWIKNDPSFIYAVKSGHEKTVRLLLDLKANPNETHCYASALEYACFYRKVAVAKILIDHLADVKGEWVSKPWVLQHKHIVQVLIQAGADITGVASPAADRRKRFLAKLRLKKNIFLWLRVLYGAKQYGNRFKRLKRMVQDPYPKENSALNQICDFFSMHNNFRYYGRKVLEFL